MYLSINTDDQLKTKAESLVIREREVFSYDLNIQNYEAILSTLPQDDWPDHLVQYKTSTLDQVPDEFDDIVNTYQFRDRIKFLVRTEKAERNKSYLIYQALMAQIPEDQRDILIAEAIQRLNTTPQ